MRLPTRLNLLRLCKKAIKPHRMLRHSIRHLNNTRSFLSSLHTVYLTLATRRRRRRKIRSPSSKWLGEEGKKRKKRKGGGPIYNKESLTKPYICSSWQGLWYVGKTSIKGIYKYLSKLHFFYSISTLNLFTPRRPRISLSLLRLSFRGRADPLPASTPD